jgi:hypothetical protein
VIERLGHHHHQYDRDRVSVELPAGATPVVVGVHEIGGAWGFSLRLSDDRGQPPEGVVLRP